MEPANSYHQSPAEIIDIRCEELDSSLLKLMLKSLNPKDKSIRTLPTLLLYDGVPSLQLYPNFD